MICVLTGGTGGAKFVDGLRQGDNIETFLDQAQRILVRATTTKANKGIKQLWTVREFPKDFELRLEFRAAVNADSGLFIRGPQLQVRDYLVAGPYKKLTKYKPQDWNEIVVVVKGQVAHCTCNGEVLEAAFKVPATGGIGLEADRGQMEYRNLRLKEIEAK